jgi:CheY-like chemotaxis protein
MNAQDALEQELRQVLSHLYDPSHQTPAILAKLLGVTEGTPLDILRPAISAAVQSLEPGAEVPRHARAWSVYQVMASRYLEQKTQEEVAQELAITVRHLARHQAEGIALLARRLWEQRTQQQPSDSMPEPADLHQVDQELAVLEQHAPGAVADVGQAIREVVHLTQVLARQRGMTLVLDQGPAGALADIHPSVLHQVLVATISSAVRGALEAEREIRLAYRVTPDDIEITLTGAQPTIPEPLAEWVVSRLLAAQGAAVELMTSRGQPVTTIRLPQSDHIVVLVIDDNQDLVHFYSLCTVNTRYRVVSVGEGRQAFEAIANHQPQVIVLDLMLPDMDGWELLAQLHEHPLSRSLPIIVCSVVREEDLALALGATFCVSKPVRRQQFREALDRALGLVATAVPRAPASSAADD